jgi:hypothetical protein
MTLVQKNGSKSYEPPPSWLQIPARQFFNSFNWDDASPQVQEIQQAIASGSSEPPSLTLSVSEFFAATSWDGNATSSTVPPSAPTPPAASANDFTLDSFSDLF